VTARGPVPGVSSTSEEPARGAATADLRREHDLILRAAAVLERVGRRMIAGHRVDEPTVTRLVGLLRALADQCHHAKEEGVLFPAMRAKGIPREGPMATMLAEHGEGRDYLGTLSGHPSPVEQAAAALLCAQVLREHVETENRLILPVADGLFTPAEHAALARQYAELEARTCGPGYRERVTADLEALERAVPG
jgi:hemerythrin-like domain-containing protein